MKSVTKFLLKWIVGKYTIIFTLLIAVASMEYNNAIVNVMLTSSTVPDPDPSLFLTLDKKSISRLTSLTGNPDCAE